MPSLVLFYSEKNGESFDMVTFWFPMATGMHLQRKRKSAMRKNGCINFAIFVGLAQPRKAN